MGLSKGKFIVPFSFAYMAGHGGIHVYMGIHITNYKKWFTDCEK